MNDDLKLWTCPACKGLNRALLCDNVVRCWFCDQLYIIGDGLIPAGSCGACDGEGLVCEDEAHGQWHECSHCQGLGVLKQEDE